MMASQEETYELRLGEDIEALCLGFTKMCVTGKKLFLYNGRKIEVPYNSKNFEETADNARKILSDSDEFEGKDLETFAALLINRLGEMKQDLREKAQQKKGEKEKSSYEKTQEAKILKCKADIEYVRNANIGIS